MQGVGFRPFVYREATGRGLAGFVCNDAGGVLIEVEGSPEAVGSFCGALVDRPPPLARVTAVEATTIEPRRRGGGFEILRSAPLGSPAVAVSVDVATCDACLAEVDDPTDRRFGYPFTNCTDCGPRYTIVTSIPYDRRSTTMAGFAMCARCRAEYDDPSDRRFHAQPNCCPACGPRLAYCRPTGELVAVDGGAVEQAAADLCGGRIVGVKGVGGFHLAADATDDDAVALLRRRKGRDERPFALMVADLAGARALCELDGEAEAALRAPAHPIVLARKRVAGPGCAVAAGVAPGLAELGLMLPYSALHHLLLRRVGRPLVMTSGNLSDDPIAHLDADAFERLGPLVAGLLTHDRAIHVRCDDSVVRATGAGLQVLRRSRGLSPEPLPLPDGARRQVLAVGGELKNTISVARDSNLVASHHIGDLEHLAAYESFVQAAANLCRLSGVEPEVVVHDLHPEYLSTKFALELDLEAWPVQHHHAHVASCLVEHGRDETVLGVAFDGLGYGSDGSLWGGEFLVADFDGFERAGHLAEVALPGGSAAIKEPWRMALSWVATAAGPGAAAGLGRDLDERWRAVLGLVEGGRCVRTTGAGRLFDAVAALLGLRRKVSYEGQAAMELEALASSVPDDEAPRYPFDVLEAGGVSILDPAPLVRAVVEGAASGVPPAVVAAGFHAGLAAGTSAVAASLARARTLRTVALTGGVFQNARLARLVRQELTAAGLEVLAHRTVPPNDGGISVGQAAIGALARRRPS